MKVLLIDNYDSFVHNLADEFRCLQCEVIVVRANMPLQQVLTLIEEAQIQALVFSPGPGKPSDAELCLQLLEYAPKSLPILGVCLGHQCIVEHFSGKVGQAEQVVHGKHTFMMHDQKGLFADMPAPMQIGRYHSLVAETVGDELEIQAAADDEVMAVKHKQHPIYGVQFHPESILTPRGNRLIRNFLTEAGKMKSAVVKEQQRSVADVC